MDSTYNSALLVLSVAFGSAIVEGEHASYFLDMITLPENSRVAVLMLSELH